MLKYENSLLRDRNSEKYPGLIFYKKYRNYFLVILVFLIASIPLLKMGFTADDISMTLIKGEILAKNITLLGYFKFVITLGMHKGRLFPACSNSLLQF